MKICALCSVLMLTLVKCGTISMLDNSFAAIRHKLTFVDKTPLVYEFLTSQHKFIFMNAPSKFGKSTNLDMLSLFLSNHRSQRIIENSFIWTKIWENKEFVATHIGQYPVIHFNLKMRGYTLDFERTIVEFKVSLYNSFIEHTYLLESEKLNETQISLLRDYMDLTKMKLMDSDSLANGFSLLAEVLHQHHGKSVILIADGFGRGITEGLVGNHIHLNLIMDLYSAILNNTLYNSNIISRAFFSGESWLYGLKGPAVSSITRVSFLQNVQLSRFYGFTYDEVEHLMTKFNVSTAQKKEVFRWYGGYATSDGLFKVCNPYSILEYLSHTEKQEIVYWTGSPLAQDITTRMLEVDSLKKHILDLILRKSVIMNLEKGIQIFEWEYIQQKVKQLPQYCENFFFQILVETGYLILEHLIQENEITLIIPNEEVRSTVVKFSV